MPVVTLQTFVLQENVADMVDIVIVMPLGRLQNLLYCNRNCGCDRNLKRVVLVIKLIPSNIIYVLFGDIQRENEV